MADNRDAYCVLQQAYTFTIATASVLFCRASRMMSDQDLRAATSRSHQPSGRARSTSSGQVNSVRRCYSVVRDDGPEVDCDPCLFLDGDNAGYAH